MRAENRRPKVHAPTLSEPAGARPEPRARAKGSTAQLRLVSFEASRPAHDDRSTALRLVLGFAAIVGFVLVGLWVEFGALERAAYLVSALACFSLYGAATWVSAPQVRSRNAGRGR